jgi:tetratricopeptide (TPR) repeat protein
MAPAASVPSEAQRQPASLTGPQLRARQEAYEARTRDDRKRVQLVNEYALWCVERGMWEEARIHLERALQVDSLAASLHNNLAILYERQGERERARQEYEIAAQLAPDKRLYRANLDRLRTALDRPPEYTDSLDVVGRPPLGSRRAPQSVPDNRRKGATP